MSYYLVTFKLKYFIFLVNNFSWFKNTILSLPNFYLIVTGISLKLEVDYKTPFLDTHLDQVDKNGALLWLETSPKA